MVSKLLVVLLVDVVKHATSGHFNLARDQMIHMVNGRRVKKNKKTYLQMNNTMLFPEILSSKLIRKLFPVNTKKRNNNEWEGRRGRRGGGSLSAKQ